MKRQLLQTLVVASFATMAFGASAENATPRELPAGAPPAMGTQNGSPTETPGSGMSNPGMNANGNGMGTNGMGTNAQGMRNRMTTEQMRDYMNARKTCGSQPTPQMESCNNEVNRKFSSVDAKCQKLSGTALGDCLRGADHGS